MADPAAELDEGGVVRTLKDLFAGAAGGIAQVLLGTLVVSLFCCSCTKRAGLNLKHLISSHVWAEVGGHCTLVI